MFKHEYAIFQRIKSTISDAENYINLLNYEPNIHSRKALLGKLNEKISQINYLSDMLCQHGDEKDRYSANLYSHNGGCQRDLTLQEISKFNGMNGNPAYVAVNGIVYDVTNNRAWATATHFGLEAGKDLTDEFASCHAAQTVLNKLKVVGKLIS